MIPKNAILVSIIGGIILGIFLELMLILFDGTGFSAGMVLSGLFAIGTLLAVVMVIHTEISHNQ